MADGRAWDEQDRMWRDPSAVALLSSRDSFAPELLAYKASGDFWDILEKSGITLLVTREYEHLAVSLASFRGRPRIGYLAAPHPSGLAVDHRRGTVYAALTRNPNQIVELRPVSGMLERADVRQSAADGCPLIPATTTIYPGALYLHDLALISGRLHGNAVGMNVVGEFSPDGFRAVWWPESVERSGGPDTSRNYLQLNSIAAGSSLSRSYFSASTDRPGKRRPGHRNFAVDGRGVIFSGRTRNVVARGLTRPHSARLLDNELWVDNSGYGEVGRVERGKFVPAARLPGWTRGLAFHDGLAFVGTSRVIPRFRHYAPGLDVDRSSCGVHVVDVASGRRIAGISWPGGNQIFAVEWISSSVTSGFPLLSRHPDRRSRDLYYGFDFGSTGRGRRRRGQRDEND
jgi:uncharacterized protein (TIGR03032 family)